jgi:hypothetical protein
MFSMLGLMMLTFIAVFYATTAWGMFAGLLIGILGIAGIGGGICAYYVIAIIRPASAGLNLSAQVFETDELAYGIWMVNDKPLTEIPMDPDERLMPVRIPFREFSKKKRSATNGGQKLEQLSEADAEGLEMIEEVHIRCPNDQCEFHMRDIVADHGQIYHRLPYLQFKTYGYVATPNPNSAPFQQAVIISPCEIDALRRIQDLIFFKGFPVMAPTTFISLSRVFEMDEHIPGFAAPAYVVSFSSWHVRVAQQLAGFTPAFMVPNLERVIQIYNLWGVREALKLQQQLSTAHARIESLEGGQLDFDKAVEATSAHQRKIETLIDMWPRRVGTKLLKPKMLAIIAAIVIAAIAITYLLSTLR